MIESVSLGDILILERRRVSLDPDALYTEIGVRSFGKGIFHKEPRTGLEVGDKDLYQVQKGDFILQITFAWEGAVGLASEHEDGMYCSTRFPTFRINTTICEPKFLLFYFKTPDGVAQLGNISPGSAGRNRVLSIKRISEVYVPLPPLDEQRRIVAHIEVLAARIAEARGLKTYTKQKIDTFWKVLSNITRSSSEYDVARLDYVVDFLDHMRVPLSEIDRRKRQGEYPYYGASGIIDYIDSYLFDEDLLLLSEDGANLLLRSKPIAFIASGKYWVNNHAHVLRPKKDIVNLAFLAYLLADYDVSHLNFASAQPKLNQKNARGIKLPLPSLEEQLRIVAYLDELQAKAYALKLLQAESAAELDTLLPSVLDRAFKGELVVETAITFDEVFGFDPRKQVALALLEELSYTVNITNLMKYAFLLQKEGNYSVPEPYHFEAYHYGPFDKGIYSDLETLERAELITLREVSNKREGYQKLIELNPAKHEAIHCQVAQLPTDLLESIQQIIREYGHLNQNELLVYVYARYPEYAIKSKRPDLIKRAEIMRLEHGW